MSDLKGFTDVLERYLKARIPFISIRSSERSRVLEVVRNLAQKINIPAYVHTLSQGMRDLVHHRTVSEDRSIMGAIDFISSQFAQRQNLTYVLTEVSDLEDDTSTARYFYDVAMLAAETGGSVVVVTANPVWNPLARLGMSVTLDVPNEDEMLAIIGEQLGPYRGQIPISWTDKEEKEAAAILAGISQIEAENVIATLLAKGKVEQEDLVELSQVKDSVFSDISGLERIYIRKQELTIGGLEGLRKWLDHERPLLTADLRERGIRPPRGVLLVGVKLLTYNRYLFFQKSYKRTLLQR